MLSWNNKKIAQICFVLFFQITTLMAPIKFAHQSSTVNIIGTNSSLNLVVPITGFTGTLNLKDNTSNTITSTTATNTITFNKGILNTGTVNAVTSMNLNPATTDTIDLGNGDFLDVSSGVVMQQVNVKTSSTASILGQPRFNSAITLASASSVLQLGITTELNQSVTGVGTVSLLSDLVIGQSIQLPSLILQNNKQLTFTGGNITTGFSNTGGGNVLLSGYTSLTVTCTLGAGADVYNFDGGGNVLNLSSAGGIIFNGTTLYLSNMHIKNFSDANPIKGSGTIYLSKVTIELSNNFTRTDGSFVMLGEDCKVITNGKTFTISGSGNSLTIDGLNLYYEQLNSSGISPFATASSGTITLLNSGLIVNALVGQSLSVSTSSNLSSNLFITPATPLTFANETANPKPVTLSGSGCFISFPYSSSSPLFTLANNVQLNINNVDLKDFNPSTISLGTSSTITFGDNTRIELGQDLTIGVSDMSWTFTGNAEIDGNGATLTVNKASGITVTGTKTLTLKNITLVAGVIDCLKALTDNDRIKLQDVNFVVKNVGYTFSIGYLDIMGITKITGGAGSLFSRVNFEFSSKGNLTIGTNAELIVDPNINLKYNANPGSDPLTYNSKRHMLFSTYTSQLTLNGCSLECTATGLALDNGTMKVVDKVTMTSTTSSGAELEFGQQLQVNMSSGAVIDLNGPARYQEAPPPTP